MKNGVYYVVGGDYFVIIKNVRPVLKTKRYQLGYDTGWIATMDDDLFVSHGVNFTEEDFNMFIYVGEF